MNDAERIAELERRVADLEDERRYYTVPIPQPLPTWPLPWVPLDVGWPLPESPMCLPFGPTVSWGKNPLSEPTVRINDQ